MPLPPRRFTRPNVDTALRGQPHRPLQWLTDLIGEVVPLPAADHVATDRRHDRRVSQTLKPRSGRTPGPRDKLQVRQRESVVQLSARHQHYRSTWRRNSKPPRYELRAEIDNPTIHS